VDVNDDSRPAGRTVGSAVQQALASKLGRCRRCMTWTAILLVTSWALVLWTAHQGTTARAALVVCALVAAPITTLASAHAAAFAMHRADGNRRVAAGEAIAAGRPGDCGCT
jgi:hypothetical protein